MRFKHLQECVPVIEGYIPQPCRQQFLYLKESDVELCINQTADASSSHLKGCRVITMMDWVQEVKGGCTSEEWVLHSNA